MIPEYFEKVVPRLLRLLETEGGSTKPSLVHGDLRQGNASLDADEDTPVIFNAVCFYAHDGYEFSQSKY